MNEKLKEIMGIVFDISPDKIDEHTSAKTVENWDSVNHMNLIVALEDEFEIEFNDDEISDLINFELIAKTLKSYKKNEFG